MVMVARRLRLRLHTSRRIGRIIVAEWGRRRYRGNR
jgi:hypothetical protein